MDTDDEREVLTITTFEVGASQGDPQWYWHTQTTNGEIVADGGEGYNEMPGAVHGFFSSQGVNTEKAALESGFSQLEKISDTKYQIKKYTK